MKKIIAIIIAAVCAFSAFPAICSEESADIVIFQSSEAVKPGQLLTLYGGGFDGDDSCILLSPIKNGNIPGETDSSTRCLATVNRGTDGSYISAIVPEDYPNGIYAARVKTKIKTSKPYIVNKARSQWISDDVISAGNEIKVIGRNFSGAEFGYNASAKVRLKKGNMSYDAKIKSTSAYAISFTVGENVPDGEYTVSVSNDGIFWNTLDNGQTVKVKRAVSDPMNLGVAWADEFCYNRIFDVTKYGADGSDDADDTAAIQNAINAAYESGGGIVYMPSGKYIFTQLVMKNGVVLKGDGTQKSYLLFDSAGKTRAVLDKWTAIYSDKTDGRNGRQGFYRFTLGLKEGLGAENFPVYMSFLGESDKRRDTAGRTAEYIFLKEFELNYTKEIPEKLGLGAFAAGLKSHFYVDSCKFFGHNANITDTYLNSYLTLTNNEFDTNIGKEYFYSEYNIYENNKITRLHNTADNTDYGTQGIYTRGKSYFTKNTIINTGNKSGDGEGIGAETYMGGTFMFGKVCLAEGTSITLNPEVGSDGKLCGGSYNNEEWDFSTLTFGAWHIVITDGKGVGQYRKIVGSDKETSTVIIDKEWDIVPDSGSKFTVVTPLDQITIDDNTFYNVSNGILLYGPTIDCIVANNKMYDSYGISTYVFDTRKENGGSDMQPGYFIRYEDNLVDGVGWSTGYSPIHFRAQLEAGQPYMRMMYGLTVRGNVMIGDGKTSEECTEFITNIKQQGFKGQGLTYNGIQIGAYNRNERPLKNVIFAVDIEDNNISNTDRGITINSGGYMYDKDPYNTTIYSKSAVEDVYLANNTFSDVTNEIVDNTELCFAEKIGEVSDALESKGTTGAAVYGDILYTVSSNSYGLRIYDVRDAENPEFIKEISDYGKIRTDASQPIAINNGFLYVAFAGGIRKFNIEDPKNPLCVSKYNAGNTYSMVFYGKYLYAAYNVNQIKIFDTNKNVQSESRQINAEASIDFKAKSLAIHGDYLYAASMTGLNIYKINNGSLEEIYSKEIPESGHINNIFADDKRIVMFDQATKKIFLINAEGISDKSKLSEREVIAWSAGLEQIDPRGGVLEGDLLYASLSPCTNQNKVNGLCVFDLKNIENPEILYINPVFSDKYFIKDMSKIYLPNRNGTLEIYKMRYPRYSIYKCDSELLPRSFANKIFLDDYKIKTLENGKNEYLFEIRNDLLSKQNINAVVAVYDESGRLVDVSLSEAYDILPGKSALIGTAELDIKDTSTVNLMLWDIMSGIKPLAKKIPLPK